MNLNIEWFQISNNCAGEVGFWELLLECCLNLVELGFVYLVTIVFLHNNYLLWRRYFSKSSFKDLIAIDTNISNTYSVVIDKSLLALNHELFDK